LKRQTQALALALGVVGLMNIQFAVKDGEIYLIEVNPRASRTVPFVAKATDSAIASIAARLMAGEPMENFPLRAPYGEASYEQSVPIADPMTLADPDMPWYSVKEAVMPFARFPGVDTILGPEMKSTGEVMGSGKTFAEAFIKSQLGAGTTLPYKGKAFLSVRKEDHESIIEIAQALAKLGFDLVATDGTARSIQNHGMIVDRINKVAQGRPHIVDMIKNKEIDFIVNITEDKKAIADSYTIRRNALMNKITYYTTLSGAKAACVGMSYVDELEVNSIQSLHK